MRNLDNIHKESLDLPKNELLFLPLGGSGEIGMNCNLYHYNGKWLLIDLGVTFNDSNYYGSHFAINGTNGEITKTQSYEHPFFSKYSIRSDANHETILQVFDVHANFKSESVNSMFQMGLIWGTDITTNYYLICEILN